MACAKDGHADVAALLLEGVDPDFVADATADGYTAVHLYLAAQKEFGTVQMMDSQTADKNRVSLYLPVVRFRCIVSY